MSLYVTELRRLAKRRMTRVLLVLLVLGLAGIATVFGFTSHKIGPAQRAAAEAQAEQAFLQQKTSWEADVKACEAAEARGEKITDRWPPDCGREYGPQREMFDSQWFLPYEFKFRTEFGNFLIIFAGAVTLVGFLLAASFVGAEWNTGGMMNLLLWRPKRLSVLASKLGAVLTLLLGTYVVLGAAWTGAFWGIATYRGNTAKVTPGVWQSVELTGLRGLGLVLAVGAVAFGLASLGRHTAMAMGGALGVVAISEIGIRMAVMLAKVPFGERYVLSTYAQSWFLKQVKLFDERSCQFVQGECAPKTLLVTWQDSAWVFGVGTTLVLVAAFWMMRRRDVS